MHRAETKGKKSETNTPICLCIQFNSGKAAFNCSDRAGSNFNRENNVLRTKKK